MSKSYTVVLNDNVVSKLQDIVGGGSPAMVTFEEFSNTITSGSHFNVANFKAFLQSREIDVTKVTDFSIAGLCAYNFQYIFNKYVYDTSSYSYYYLSDVLDNLETEIEQTTYSGYGAIQGEVGTGTSMPITFNGVLPLIMVYSVDNSVDPVTTYNEIITWDEVLSFIDIYENE